MTVFDPIFDASVLEEDVTSFLNKWFRTYSAEISEQRGFGRDKFKTPKYWTTTPVLTPDAVQQVRYPAVLVLSTGLVGRPVRKGDGRYDGTYALGVTVLATADNDQNASKMAKRYGAAVRTLILQKPAMETDYITEVAWTDERFTDYLQNKQTAVGSATEIFEVTVKDILGAKAGPGIPDPLPEPATAPNPSYEDRPVVRDPEGDPDAGEAPYESITTVRFR